MKRSPGTFLGITDFYAYESCNNCKRKVDHDTKTICTNCDTAITPKSHSPDFRLEIDMEQQEKQVKVTVFKEVAEKLLPRTPKQSDHDWQALFNDDFLGNMMQADIWIQDDMKSSKIAISLTLL